MSLVQDFTRGIWKENPVLVLLLGMCPTLAVTSNAKNGLGMGLATVFVLLGSNIVISCIRGIVPKKIRIPCYIVVIATFVSVVEMLMKAYLNSSGIISFGVTETDPNPRVVVESFACNKPVFLGPETVTALKTIVLIKSN